MTRRETFFSKVSVVVDLKCVGFPIWNDHCCIKKTVPDTFVTFYFLFLRSKNVSGVTCAD